MTACLYRTVIFHSVSSTCFTYFRCNFLRTRLSVLKDHINTVHRDSSAGVLHLIWHYPAQQPSCQQYHRKRCGDLVGSELQAKQLCALEAREASQCPGRASGSRQATRLFQCSRTAVPSLQCSKIRRRSRGGRVLGWKPLRYWRICFARRQKRRHCRELVAGAVEKSGPGSPGRCTVAGQGTVATSGSEGNCRWM